MQKTFCVYKNLGETPLECLNRVRENVPSLKDATLSYAGRLDPLAEGLLVLLVNEENKRREEYLHLDKKYRFDVIFDVATDTHDVLGKIRDFTERSIILSPDSVKRKLASFVGSFEQPYPLYSSKPVMGKPLFQWARIGKANDIVRPIRKVTIYSLELSNLTIISRAALEGIIFKKLSLVSGDFRQLDIVREWEAYFSHTKKQEYTIGTIDIHCSSGTYVRVISDMLGRMLGTFGTALDIKRTHVGDFSIEEAFLKE